MSSFKNFHLLSSTSEFRDFALDLFRHQVKHNAVYGEFKDRLLGSTPVDRLEDIPFLPVSFFKNHSVKSGTFDPAATFTSSTTTGQTPSRHEVFDLQHYERSFLESFRRFYGAPEDWTILALLPAYLERQGSSLVYMADRLIQLSQSSASGFYLYDHQELSEQLNTLEKEGKKTLLLGVTFALLDFAENYPQDLQHTVVMETGGMKGKRKEMIREEVHQVLRRQLGVSEVHSEYGMTELLSQAYSKCDGIYQSPSWMKVLIRSSTDPLSILPQGKAGGINVIDLANRDSCAFLATQDLGRVLPDESFEILGRFDNSDIRGCNLMVV